MAMVMQYGNIGGVIVLLVGRWLLRKGVFTLVGHID